MLKEFNTDVVRDAFVFKKCLQFVLNSLCKILFTQFYKMSKWLYYYYLFIFAIRSIFVLTSTHFLNFYPPTYYRVIIMMMIVFEIYDETNAWISAVISPLCCASHQLIGCSNKALKHFVVIWRVYDVVTRVHSDTYYF